MRLFNNLSFGFLPFYKSPDDEGGTTVAEMIDLMGSDDNPDEDHEKVVTDTEGVDLLSDDKGKDKKADSKEEDKETDKEDSDEEPSDEELEDDYTDFSRKEFLKAYPDAFKKFPQLEKAFYREQKYAEVFPTIEDAETASEKAKQYDSFEQSLMSGNNTTILKSLKDADNAAFSKVVDGYLDALGQVDKEAYYHVIGNTFRSGISAMVTEAERIGGDDGQALKNAALILNRYMFGTSKYTPPSNFSKEPVKNEEQDKLNDEKKQFLQERFDSALTDLSTRARNTIRHTISEHIDPKESMTDYVRRVAINEALENVEKAVDGDARFKTQLDKLWEKAFEARFSQASLKNIERAYFAKVKTLLPQYIQKSRNAALKGLGKRVSEDKEEVKRKGPVSVNRPAAANNSGDDKKSVPKGMKTIDFLNMD
jgi:hypothetical protein